MATWRKWGWRLRPLYMHQQHAPWASMGVTGDGQGRSLVWCRLLHEEDGPQAGTEDAREKRSILGHTSSHTISHWETVPKIGLAEVKGGTISASGKNITTEMVWRGKVSEHSIRTSKCYVLWLFDVEQMALNSSKYMLMFYHQTSNLYPCAPKCYF